MEEARPQEGEKKPTSIAEFRRVSRKLIELPSGRSVLVRKLIPYDFLDLKLFPDPEPGLDEEKLLRLGNERAELIAQDPQKLRDAVVYAVCHAAVEPRVYEDEHAVGADGIHWTELGDDLIPLHNALMEFSGFGGSRTSAFQGHESVADQEAPKSSGLGGEEIQHTAT